MPIATEAPAVTAENSSVIASSAYVLRNTLLALALLTELCVCVLAIFESLKAMYLCSLVVILSTDKHAVT